MQQKGEKIESAAHYWIELKGFEIGFPDTYGRDAFLYILVGN